MGAGAKLAEVRSVRWEHDRLRQATYSAARRNRLLL